VLLLEGRDGQTWKDHVRNYAPCHFPHVDGKIDLSLAIFFARLRYMLCGQAMGVAITLICDRCSKG